MGLSSFSTATGLFKIFKFNRFSGEGDGGVFAGETAGASVLSGFSGLLAAGGCFGSIPNFILLF
jgi:hypothetical protein